MSTVTQSPAGLELTKSQAWQALQNHYNQIAHHPMTAWFAEDQNRFAHFSLESNGILLDYSKNRINTETLKLLISLAEQNNLTNQREELFSGKKINVSEQRPAMHMALRNIGNEPKYVDGINVMPEVIQSWEQITAIVDAIDNRDYLGFNNQPIDTIVNIGIGGSDFGPQLLQTALAAYVNPNLNYHFLSTHDQWHVNQLLNKLNPATTLFIITSKSFTTEETLANAKMVKNWQLAAVANPLDLQRHWIAVTAMPSRAIEFGIAPEQVLAFWDWVGGRYSVWSAVSLIVAIAIGMPRFKQFLAGGFAMDEHFQKAELSQNMPVILALLDIWYQNFFHTPTRAILPYGQRLRLLPDYLQQLHMESLGKRVDQQGKNIDYQTGGIIWGGVGTNSQHSFHQLLMQGTELVPADFVLTLDKNHSFNKIEDHLLSHCLAQTQVLMSGYNGDVQSNHGKSELPSYQIIPGNVPSNTLLLSDLSPFHLGELIALYEHKVFTYAAILHINPFDQWGVERGKRIANQICSALHDSKEISCYDSSTRGLLEWVRKQQRSE